MHHVGVETKWNYTYILDCRAPKVQLLLQCIQAGIYTWNPNDRYFWRSTPQNKVFSNQNKGHLGSRYIYIYTYTHRLVGYVDHLYEFDMFCRLQSRQIPGAYVLKVSSCAHLATAVQKAGLDRCW